MSSSSESVQVTMCPRYLKLCTNSISDEPICSLGRSVENILVLFSGGNNIHTVLFTLNVMSISSTCIENTFISCCDAVHDNIFFCSVLVKYEPISTKIGRHVLEETLNTTVKKFPTSAEICV